MGPLDEFRDMVKALQMNAINDFKRYYRSVDALLIDDIQFIAGKESTQEEFFHTFNALFENNQQIVLTCDRYPKEVDGLEDRLKSRFGWGLTVAIEPPELETSVAILMSKACQCNITLPDDVAFFIAKCIQSNIRELEGALRRVIASARFTGQPISLELAREALRDLLVLGVMAGIGFTVALFVATVAFPKGDELDAAKMGALFSFGAAILAFLVARPLKVGRFAKDRS